jgi:hypothetical protein
LCKSATAVFSAEIEGTVELYLYCKASTFFSNIKAVVALCRSATSVFSAEIEGTAKLYLYCTASTLSFKY